MVDAIDERERSMLLLIMIAVAMLVITYQVCQHLPQGFGFSILAAILTIIATPIVGIAAAYAVYISGAVGSAASVNDIVGTAFTWVVLIAIASPVAVWYFRRSPRRSVNG